jgi:hypothetical protein
VQNPFSDGRISSEPLADKQSTIDVIDHNHEGQEIYHDEEIEPSRFPEIKTPQSAIQQQTASVWNGNNISMDQLQPNQDSQSNRKH